MDYKSCSLEMEILLEQRHRHGIVDGTDNAPDEKNMMNMTESKP